MLSKEFDLPEELVEVLPSDPFEQLDVARKITSIALATRVSALETEVSDLRQQLADRDAVVSALEEQLQSLDASAGEAAEKLAEAQQEKERLMRENLQLSSTVRKLHRDVAKLEGFRKTLMRSLQEEDENPGSAPPTAPSIADDDASLPPTRTPSMRSTYSDVGNSFAEDTETEAMPAARPPRISHGLLLASQTSTPRLTPPGSPPTLSASASPSRTPKPLSPRRRHSIAVSRGVFDDQYRSSSVFSSTSSFDSGSQSGKTRVDGKEFFRQVRNRLSYEQFGAFLANVKELNSHKQTKEETLRKADEVFGPDNKDLYAIFEGLIMRNVQ